VQDSRGPDPKELLASGQVSSMQLFEAVLADRDNLLEKIAKEQAEKREFEGALLRSRQLVALQQEEIRTLRAGVRRGPA
jgi:hypothetical protein